MDSRVVAMVAVAGALAGWGLWYGVRPLILWRRLRAEREVTCRQNSQPATVYIDLALALDANAGSESLDASPLRAARGHYERRTAASALVRAWAKGRACVSCGGEVTESRFAGHHIALLEPGGMTREWVDVAADTLPLALATSLPLCWNCHVAAQFRRIHPELVTDRDETTVHVRRY